MKRGILTLSVIAVAAMSFSANAAEMMRYERQYYDSQKREIPFENQKFQQRKEQQHKVGTQVKNPENHIIYDDSTPLRDRN